LCWGFRLNICGNIRDLAWRRLIIGSRTRAGLRLRSHHMAEFRFLDLYKSLRKIGQIIGLADNLI
jgi:hypothetical protein